VRRHQVLFTLICFIAPWTAFAQTADSSRPNQQQDQQQEQQQQGNPPAPPCTVNCPQDPAKPASNPDSPAKPPARPHKVFTNDDIDARPHEFTVSGTRDILQQLNNCDRTCFDQVAQRGGMTGAAGPRWKLALLDAVDAVKADSTWQGILGEMIGVQGNACEVQAQKTADIQKFSDPRSVTPEELAIERQYEPKFREIRGRLNAALDRANAHIIKSGASPVQAQYMNWQTDKIVHATCTINVPKPPDDTDDPADP
jgi:hypothetical protein